MCELGDEELSSKKPTEKEPKESRSNDIGYFINANGYKQFGVIPKTDEELYEKTRPRKTDS